MSSDDVVELVAAGVDLVQSHVHRGPVVLRPAERHDVVEWPTRHQGQRDVRSQVGTDVQMSDAHQPGHEIAPSTCANN